MRRHLIASLLVVVGIALSCPAEAQTAAFDFDSNGGGFTAGMRIPLLLASGGFTALFSSPAGSVFSLQSDATTHFRLSQFSGLYLYPDSTESSALDIEFNRPLSAITLTFATADFQQVEVPTAVQLTAYKGAVGSAPVGTTTAHGTYAGDTMPMGTLSFASTAPFDVVRLEIPAQTNPAAGFLVDNVWVTVATVPRTRRVLRRVQTSGP